MNRLDALEGYRACLGGYAHQYPFSARLITNAGVPVGCMVTSSLLCNVVGALLLLRWEWGLSFPAIEILTRDEHVFPVLPPLLRAGRW